jgi:hypothetical protein
MFTDTATALVGSPHGAPVINTARDSFCGSGVKFLESYCRHGVVVTNWYG